MIGLRLRTEDLAKFGQLLMQNGKWNNKQLIPAEWVKEATSFKIESRELPTNCQKRRMTGHRVTVTRCGVEGTTV